MEMGRITRFLPRGKRWGFLIVAKGLMPLGVEKFFHVQKQ